MRSAMAPPLTAGDVLTLSDPLASTAEFRRCRRAAMRRGVGVSYYRARTAQWQIMR